MNTYTCMRKHDNYENRNGYHYTSPFAMSRGEFRTRRGGWRGGATRAQTTSTVGCFICLEEVVSAEKYAFNMPCCSQIIDLKWWETWEDVKKESGQDPSCPMCRTRWKGDYTEMCFRCFRPVTSQMEWWPRCAPEERRRFRHVCEKP